MSNLSTDCFSVCFYDDDIFFKQQNNAHHNYPNVSHQSSLVSEIRILLQGDLWRVKPITECVTFFPSANLTGVITVDWHMGKLCFRRKPSGIMFAGRPSHLQSTKWSFYIQGNIVFRQTFITLPVPMHAWCISCIYQVYCTMLLTTSQTVLLVAF